jgi:cyanophycinase
MKNAGCHVLTLILLLSFTNGFGQGRLLLAGGGNEKNSQNGWSTPAYTWAAQGKRVAVISNDGSGYVPYFINQCGAKSAKDFIIPSQTLANEPALYDTLITYGFIFFAGGDQWDYYANFKGTWLQRAVDTLYVRGGTIGGTSAGMHILSETVFTAQNGTVYPDECIENPLNQYMKLSDDFFHFMPSYIFDTHVAERGRFARLVSFVANRAIANSQKTIGFGLDDMTCMTVDENMLGTIYGTGAATLVLAEPHQFSQSNTHLKADSISIWQLLHGCTYNFITGATTITTLSQNISPALSAENAQLHVFTSGSNSYVYNKNMLEAFAIKAGSNRKILAICSTISTTVTQFVDYLQTLGLTNLQVLPLQTATGNDANEASAINQSEGFLFINNTINQLSTYLETPNGHLLNEKIRVPGTVLAFVGSDSRLPGAKVIENYTTSGASYYGELVFLEGLNLLPNTVIMPETFSNSDYYENTSTAIPYAMVTYSLGYGIWLTNDNYMAYSYNGNNSYIRGKGKAPVMLLINNGLKGGLSQHTATGAAGNPRQVAGFDQMLFYALGDDDTLSLGSSVGVENELVPDELYTAYTDHKKLVIRCKIPSTFQLCLYDVTGRQVMNCILRKPEEILDLSYLKNGIYLAHIQKDSIKRSFKIILN